MKGALVVMALAACDGSARFFDDPTQPLPAQLSDLSVSNLDADELRSYTPAWPLWSNGSDKQRTLFLPSPIDTSDPARWQFPVGTTLMKTFAYDRPIETRVIRRLDDSWAYDVYLWDADGSDATLLPLDIGVEVAVEVDGEAFMHRVPNRLDCRTCHESAAVPVLGFASVQLAEDALAKLDADGLRTDPHPPARIEHSDSATREVLGYFQGNCVHCHNGGTGPSSSFDLRHESALANIIDQQTDSSASAQGIRVVPGSSAASILFLAVSGESDDTSIKPMPPVGVQRRDAGAIEQLRAWIDALL